MSNSVEYKEKIHSEFLDNKNIGILSFAKNKGFDGYWILYNSKDENKLKTLKAYQDIQENPKEIEENFDPEIGYSMYAEKYLELKKKKSGVKISEVTDTYSYPSGVYIIGDLDISQSYSLIIYYQILEIISTGSETTSEIEFDGLVCFFKDDNEKLLHSEKILCKEFVEINKEIIGMLCKQNILLSLLDMGDKHNPNESKSESGATRIINELNKAKFKLLALSNGISGARPLVYLKHGTDISFNDTYINEIVLQRLKFELMFKSYCSERLINNKKYNKVLQLFLPLIEGYHKVFLEYNLVGGYTYHVTLYFINQVQYNDKDYKSELKIKETEIKNSFLDNYTKYKHKLSQNFENGVASFIAEDKLIKELFIESFNFNFPDSLFEKGLVFYTISRPEKLQIDKIKKEEEYYYPSMYYNDYYKIVNNPDSDTSYFAFSSFSNDQDVIIEVFWNKSNQLIYKELKRFIVQEEKKNLQKEIWKLFIKNDPSPINLDTKIDLELYGITTEDLERFNSLNKQLFDRAKSSYLQVLTKFQFFIAATQAAISQVMVRNLSHNIGSHVLSKLDSEDLVAKIHYLLKNNPKGIIDAKISSTPYAIVNEEFYQCLNKIEKVDCLANDEDHIDLNHLPSNENLIANFFIYLRQRMDYLADITTSTPVIENSKYFYSDIIVPFIKNRVLNDRISGITKFIYNLTLCKPPLAKHKECVHHTTQKCYDSGDNHIVKNNNNDFQVSIPNDVVGIHAFYTILENIIRNTAKHAIKPKNGKVEFKIKVLEANELFSQYQNELNELNLNEYYVVSVFDNCEITGKVSLDEKPETEKQNFRTKYRILIETAGDENNINKIDKLVFDQNFWLNESVLDDKTNRLREGHWGLIEMDASAAYLRKIPVEQIDSDDYNIDDLTGINPISEGKKLCVFQAYIEQEKYLGYRFFIRKPHEVLIIESETNEVSSTINNVQKLENEGIWIKKISKVQAEIKKESAFPHKLVVLTSKANSFIAQIRNNALFSKRILKEMESDKFDFTQVNKLWYKYYSLEEKKPYYISNSMTRNLNATSTHHGDIYCESLSGQRNGINGSEIGNKFVEIQFSATEHFFDNSIRYEQSWPLKILVIDERIQSLSKERYKIKSFQNCSPNGECFHENGVPYRELYKNTNIIIPPDEIDLNEQSFDNNYNKIIEFIKIFTKPISEDSNYGNGIDHKPCEFIVIHLGVIEKLIASSNRIEDNNIDKEKTEQVGKFIKNKVLGLESPMTDDDKAIYDRIIITSGRGKPHNLPNDIRYLNFSAVSQYLTVQRNKYALSEALFSARKIVKF